MTGSRPLPSDQVRLQKEENRLYKALVGASFSAGRLHLEGIHASVGLCSDEEVSDPKWCLGTL